MDAAANHQIADYVAPRLIGGHLITAVLVHGRAGLKKEVVQKISDKAAAREDVLARPEVTHGIHDRTTTCANNGVVGVAEVGSVDTGASDGFSLIEDFRLFGTGFLVRR